MSHYYPQKSKNSHELLKIFILTIFFLTLTIIHIKWLFSLKILRMTIIINTRAPRVQISAKAHNNNPVNILGFCKHLKGNVWQRLKNDGYENHL